MYLFLLAFLYVVTYIFGIVWFQKFAQKSIEFSPNFFHILMILGVYFGIIFGVVCVPDAELGNRIQHMIGGGCMIPFIAFLSYKKSGIHLSKFVLFHIFFLITLGFGVGNELLESFFQLHYGYIFAPNLADTWYDLWANTIGALIASLFFMWISDCKTKN